MNEQCSFNLEFNGNEPVVDISMKLDKFNFTQFRFEMLLNSHSQGFQDINQYLITCKNDEDKNDFYESLINLMLIFEGKDIK